MAALISALSATKVMPNKFADFVNVKTLEIRETLEGVKVTFDEHPETLWDKFYDENGENTELGDCGKGMNDFMSYIARIMPQMKKLKKLVYLSRFSSEINYGEFKTAPESLQSVHFENMVGVSCEFLKNVTDFRVNVMFLDEKDTKFAFPAKLKHLSIKNIVENDDDETTEIYMGVLINSINTLDLKTLILCEIGRDCEKEMLISHTSNIKETIAIKIMNCEL
jgi:hypothetical protein